MRTQGWRSAVPLCGLAAGLAMVVTGCAAFTGGESKKYPAGLAPADVAGLGSNDPMVQAKAHEAFMRGGAASVPGLEDCATSAGDAAARTAAIGQLRDLALGAPLARNAALEALVSVYVKRDPVTQYDASAALERVGEPALPALMERCLATADAGGRTALLTMMAQINKKATIDAFIAKLGNPAAAAQEPLVISTLGELTGQYFDYDPKGAPEIRQAVCQQWRDWWAVEKDKMAGPAPAIR